MVILPRREAKSQVRSYKCIDCGADFLFPKIINYGFCDSQMGVPVCPDCASTNIAGGTSCPLCGRFTTDFYCADCAQNLRERFSDLLKSNFTPEEIKALNEIFDGKELE